MADSKIIKRKIPRQAKPVSIKVIKPLQTKLSEEKLNAVRQWMTPESKFFIFVVTKGHIKYISDGHHRLYVANELGIETIYAQERKNGDTKKIFSRQKPEIDHISKLEIVSAEEFDKYIKL